jgi:hypothetical protein
MKINGIYEFTETGPVDALEGRRVESISYGYSNTVTLQLYVCIR